MSWLGSLAGSLREDSRSLSEVEEFPDSSSEWTIRPNSWKQEDQEFIKQVSPRRRAKEDLSDFTKALSGKLWGVASFLAPSSSSQTSPSSSTHMIYSVEPSTTLRSKQRESENSGESGIMASLQSSRPAGIRNDFAEIGGSLKTGITRLSNKVAIKRISKIASTFLPFREEGEEKADFEREEEEEEAENSIDISCVIGVTDEVLAFARNIACHPETWLDFPLPSDDEDFDDFDMSIAQQDHALAIENLAPRLAALRIELCPAHMSIGCFWKIYFALLHPRLKKPDAELLSTPQIEEARAMLHNGLQIQSKHRQEGLSGHSLFKVGENDFSYTKASSFKHFEREKHSFVNLAEEFVDKFVVNEKPYRQHPKMEELILLGEDDDEWPEDESQDANNTSAEMAAFIAYNEDDITFSDLEEDGDGSLVKQACGILHCKSGSLRYV